MVGNIKLYGNYIVTVVPLGIKVFRNFNTFVLSAVFSIANVESITGPLVLDAGYHEQIYG